MPRPEERNQENVEFEECSGNTNNNIIIVGTLGGITRKLDDWVGKLGITL